jgi:hypothetical protein
MEIAIVGGGIVGLGLGALSDQYKQVAGYRLDQLAKPLSRSAGEGGGPARRAGRVRADGPTRTTRLASLRTPSRHSGAPQ